MPEDSPDSKRVTSVEIGRITRMLCWAFGVVLVGAGGVATFLSSNQAGTTALVLFGGLLLFVGITKRLPLLLEVGTAKFDTSYERVDEAFLAGRESAEQSLEPVSEAPVVRFTTDTQLLFFSRTYSSPVAARAAGISYRQLDYWARTELVTPSGRPSNEEARKGALSRYSFKDIVLLSMARQLLDLGMSLQIIRDFADLLRGIGNADLSNALLVHDRTGSRIVWIQDPGYDNLSPARTIIRVGDIVNQMLVTLADLDHANISTDI